MENERLARLLQDGHDARPPFLIFTLQLLFR